MTPDYPYWGGSTLEGPIRPMEARTFQDLVRRYIDVAVQLPMSRLDFQAMVKRDRDAVKAGPYLTACSFVPGTTRRRDEHKDRLTILFLDIDSGTEAAHLSEGPEVISEALAPFNFFAYHTANSTAERPRLRVGIDLVPCDPALRFRLVSFFARRLALPDTFAGSAESTVTTQPMFRPNTFLHEDQSPVIASRTNGQPFDPALLPDAPEADAEPRLYSGTIAFDDSFGLAYLPIQGLTVEDIREPLFKIDPDSSYPVWSSICAALRHQFRGEDEARLAFDLWEEWCATGGKYRAGEPWRKWRSYHADAKGRAPTTIRSLFHLAKQAGWENTKVAVHLQQTLAEWIGECGDASVLMTEGPARIAAMPFHNAVVEEALVNTLRARIRALSKQQIDKATIVKAVRRERKDARLAQEENDSLEPWLRPIKFIGPSNIFRNAVNGVEYSPSAFDNAFSRHLMGGQDSDNTAIGRPVILPSLHALNVRMIETVDGVTYDPRFGGDEPIFEYEGRTYLNEYRRSSIPPEEPGSSVRAMALIRRLLNLLIGDPRHEATLLDFIAFQVQQPGRKVRWFPIIQSVQGAGKGTLWAALGAAIGPANFGIVPPGTLNENFNSWKYGHQFVEIDELKSPGHNRHDIYNKLKDAVTNDSININQKYRDPRMVCNVTNYAASTNYHDCIPLEEGDRRCFVLKSPIQHKGQIVASGLAELLPQVRELIAKHPGGIRHALLGHGISPDFNPDGHAPETVHRAAMIEGSKHPMQVSIERFAASGRHPSVWTDLIDQDALESEITFDRRFCASADTYLRAMGYVQIPLTAIWYHPSYYGSSGFDPSKIFAARAAAGELDI